MRNRSRFYGNLFIPFSTSLLLNFQKVFKVLEKLFLKIPIKGKFLLRFPLS